MFEKWSAMISLREAAGGGMFDGEMMMDAARRVCRRVPRPTRTRDEEGRVAGGHLGRAAARQRSLDGVYLRLVH